MRSAKMSAIVVAVAVAGMASMSVARADAQQAKSLLKAMSDYLAAQKAISFDYDTNLEIVSTQQQKIGLASSGTLTLERPDKLHATRKGGFANLEMVFDGKTLTLLGKNANLYAQVDAPGTIDQLVDVLRDKYHRPVPAADLLMSDPYKELMPPVTDVKDLGSGVIHGIECDHLAFRTKEVDWQIWIAQGARPYPCRYVISVSVAPTPPCDRRRWTDDRAFPEGSVRMSGLHRDVRTEPDTFRRVEVITGVARRRHWPRSEKARIVAESYAPGASATAVAVRHGAASQSDLRLAASAAQPRGADRAKRNAVRAGSAGDARAETGAAVEAGAAGSR